MIERIVIALKFRVVRRCFWPAIFIGFAVVEPASAQQRALLTEDVDIVKTGHIRLQAGSEVLRDQRFGLSGLRGNLTRPVVVGVNFGMNSNVGFSIEGSLRNVLSISQRGPSAIPLSVPAGASSTSDVGDFTLSTKIKFWKQTTRAPSLAFKLSVQLPNSDQSRGIGLNTTNVAGIVLVGKKYLKGRLNTFGNIGLGILTSAVDLGAQHDVLMYGAGGIYEVSKRFDVLAEMSGRYNPRQPVPGLESLAQARFGARRRAGGLLWDLAGMVGLSAFSPRRGIMFGVTYEFSAFEPVR
jgi:Putative MetA-pathway of phenol degradation